VPLTAGTRIGPYEIKSPLGEGGMGVVFRALDTKLQREVALKLLPDHFADDPERLARFQREAQVLASLNHPNIAQIHGLEDSTAQTCIVMELVEGETLQERLRRGAIPIDEALLIAKQICEALEAAHEKGIIHRDLKPANIKLTKDGAVKVLDFGLARMREAEGAASNLSNSPTLMSAASMPGMIMGTAAYMSPEQAKGRPVDGRTDIFAFGAVLYEMLTARQAFQGETVSEILASVLIREPDFSLLPHNLNPRLHEILRRCLDKNPKRRWYAAADLRIELEAVASDIYRKPETVQRGTRERLWISAVVVLTLIAFILAVMAFRPSKPPDELRLEIMTPPTSDPFSLAISPDGRQVAFVANQQDKSMLFVRALDSTAARPIPGTEGARFPFWSPDNRSLGFFADRALKRIDVAGGVPQVLATPSNGLGGSWSANGTIIFAPRVVSSLYRIPAAGGEAIPITHVEPPLTAHQNPQFLPDGKHFLFSGLGSSSAAGVYVGSLDDFRIKRLFGPDTHGVYDLRGFLILGRQGTLLARSFDLRRLELRGDPILIADHLAFEPLLPAAWAAANGVIVYRTGSDLGLHQLVWFDRAGEAIAALAAPDSHDLEDPELSFDEKRVTVRRAVDGNLDVWTIDVTKGVLSRFTSDPAADTYPTWSPDARWLAFASSRKGTLDLYRKLSNNEGSEELLLASSQVKSPLDWSSDGKFILYAEVDQNNGTDLWALPLSGDKKPIPIANTLFNEVHGRFSPDVRWVAYASDLSGHYEIYVKPFGRSGGEQMISANGGLQPRWRQDGKEIFYIAPDNTLMSVPIQISSGGQLLEAGTPVALFHSHVFSKSRAGKQQYAVSRDGQRFLMNVSLDDATPSPISVLLNWKPSKDK